MKKQPLLFLVFTIGFLLATEITLHIIYGYYASGYVLLLLLMGVISVVRYILILTCIGGIAWLASKKHFEKVVVFSLIALISIGIVPKVHFETLGSLISLFKANPQHVLNDARLLADKYPEMTCIGYENQRFPCNEPVSRNNLPPSFKSMHAVNVLILNDYVLIEKFGLQGVFRGFVIFRNDSNIWIDEQAITHQKGCFTCLRVRIINGLYWYQAGPNDPPIFTSPLQ